MLSPHVSQDPLLQSGEVDLGAAPWCHVDGLVGTGTTGEGTSLHTPQWETKARALSPLGPNGLNKQIQDQCGR